MGKKNKNKVKRRQIQQTFSWSELKKLRTNIVDQLLGYVKIVNDIKRQKILLNANINIEKINNDMAKFKEDLGEEFENKEKEIFSKLATEYGKLNNEDDMLINGVMKLLEDKFIETQNVTKNHITNKGNVLEITEEELDYRKGTIANKDLDVFITCVGEYVGIQEDLKSLAPKIMLELSEVLGEDNKYRKELMENYKNLLKEYNDIEDNLRKELENEFTDK